MEGNASDVLRVLSLVGVWAIPAILVLLVAIFAILTPVFISAGAVSRFFQVIRERLQRRGHAPWRRAAKATYGTAKLAR